MVLYLFIPLGWLFYHRIHKHKNTKTVVITNELFWFRLCFRSGDPHIKDGYLLNINLRHEHNHQLSCADAVLKRDVSEDAELKTLFESGDSPSSALDTMDERPSAAKSITPGQ